jgi:hypothetical protein
MQLSWPNVFVMTFLIHSRTVLDGTFMLQSKSMCILNLRLTKELKVRCPDCGRNHREIFAVPGSTEDVVRSLEEAAEEINTRLTGLFGL